MRNNRTIGEFQTFDLLSRYMILWEKVCWLDFVSKSHPDDNGAIVVDKATTKAKLNQQSIDVWRSIFPWGIIGADFPLYTVRVTSELAVARNHLDHRKNIELFWLACEVDFCKAYCDFSKAYCDFGKAFCNFYKGFYDFCRVTLIF